MSFVDLTNKLLWKINFIYLFIFCCIDYFFLELLLEQFLIVVYPGMSRYGESVERMSVEEFEQGKEWLNNTFHLIR